MQNRYRMDINKERGGEVREKFNEIKKLVDECYRKMQECKKTRRHIHLSL